jgi:FlgD Ig-like domain
LKRLLPTLIVLVLLGCTVAAFAFTERLKLDKSPISRMQVDSEFSPVCNCPTDIARIAFRLAKADRMTLSVVDAEKRTVRTLTNDRLTSGFRRYAWNGRDNDGNIVPPGRYGIRIQLGELDRTFFPPNRIEVDTAPPRVQVTGVRPRVFSPDGDRRADGTVVGYRLSEPARAFLLVNGKPRVIAKVRLTGGELHWYGLLNGRSFRSGSYRLEVVARDRAGNVSRPVDAGKVHIRYIKIVEDEIRVRAGRRARVYISTDARLYRWRIGKHTGAARRRLLRLPPLHKGRYRLVVEANGHFDRAYVIVTKRR